MSSYALPAALAAVASSWRERQEAIKGSWARKFLHVWH